MKITITIEDHELTETDKTLIQECLGLAELDVPLALTKLSKTAFMEYVKMFKEKGIPTRADEVQQERLYFLLNYFYENRLPSESDISSVFQLTPSQSRTLLRNTKSRYRNKISEFIKNTLRDTLNSSALANDESGYRFICTSTSTVEELNSIVSQKGPELKSIEKIRGVSSMYSCSVDTYNLLQKELN